MNQPELTLSTSLPTVTRKAPRLWVKELAVYREWSPDALQRRISLRTGLNIIWAEPSPRGAAGHAAGKTTFCRFVRYLLGDSNYGSDTFRDAFRLKFPNAWIVGEVCVDGESWLVARFSGITGPTHWSARGATFDQLFDPELPHEHYAEFTRQLTDAFIQPLPIAEFPSSGKEVAWIHLLAWLTRDQEARYDHVLDWRSGYLLRHESPALADDCPAQARAGVGLTHRRQERRCTATMTRSRSPQRLIEATDSRRPRDRCFGSVHQSHTSMPTTLMGYDALTGLRLTDTEEETSLHLQQYPGEANTG